MTLHCPLSPTWSGAMLVEIQRTKTGPFSIMQQITSIVLNCLIFQSYLVEMVSHICKLGTCLGQYRLVQQDGVMVPSNNFMDYEGNVESELYLAIITGGRDDWASVHC